MHPVSHDSLFLPQACYLCQQRIMQLLRREGSSARALLLHALAPPQWAARRAPDERVPTGGLNVHLPSVR